VAAAERGERVRFITLTDGSKEGTMTVADLPLPLYSARGRDRPEQLRRIHADQHRPSVPRRSAHRDFGPLQVPPRQRALRSAIEKGTTVPVSSRYEVSALLRYLAWSLNHERVVTVLEQVSS